MKKKNTNILLIAILLLIISVVLVSKQSNSTFNGKESNFAVTDTSTVTKMFLADKLGNQITIEKNAKNVWIVNDSLEALQEKVFSALKTLKQIKVQKPVPKAMHNNVVSRLAARSVKVEIYQTVYRINLFDVVKLFPYEKNTRTMYIGGETADKLGTFFLMKGAESPYIVYIPGFRGFVSTRFTAKLSDWRTHKVFQAAIKDIDYVEIKYNREPEQSFRIENIENRAFKLYDIKNQKYVPQFDTIKVIEYLTAYRNIRFDRLLNLEMELQEQDSIRKVFPTHEITVKKISGDQQVVKTRYMPANGLLGLDDKPLDHNPDQMYAVINNGEDLVTIQFFVFDKILKKLGHFTGAIEERNTSSFKNIM